MAVIAKCRRVCSADVSGNAEVIPKVPRVGPAGPTPWSLEQEPRFTAEGVSWELDQGRWNSNREEAG